jgi:hypothetical protein
MVWLLTPSIFWLGQLSGDIGIEREKVGGCLLRFHNSPSLKLLIPDRETRLTGSGLLWLVYECPLPT